MADPIAPKHVSRLLASFLFLDHLNELFVSESRLHSSVLQLAGLYTKLEEIQGLRSLTVDGAVGVAATANTESSSKAIKLMIRHINFIS